MLELTMLLRRISGLSGGQLYYVGGTVRDQLAGRPANDIDVLACRVDMPKLLSVLHRFGTAVRTGDDFEVIRFTPNDGLPSVEIALPRTEKVISPGVFEAKHDPNLPIVTDLYRRDFTVNAMAASVHGDSLIDPYGGRADLKAKRLRFIHNRSTLDDPLRILRGIRFVSQLGLVPDDDAVQQMRRYADLLTTVKADRFRKELLGIVSGPYADVALRLMQQTGALAIVLPELEAAVDCTQNAHHSFDVWEHTVRVVKHTPSDDPIVKLAALFHDVGKPPTRWVGVDGVAHFYWADEGTEYAEAPEIPGAHEEVGADITADVLRRLRFSTHDTERVSKLVREHMFIQGDNLRRRAARRFLSRLEGSPGGIEANLRALFHIREGDSKGGKETGYEDVVALNNRFRDVCLEELEKDNALTVRDLALNGHDFIALGFFGPEIGVVQKKLLDLVIDDPELNTPEELTRLIREGHAP